MRIPVAVCWFVSLFACAVGCGGEGPPVSCDETEAGCGSTDSTSPDFECDGKVCIYENVAGPCVAEWECADISGLENQCKAVELKPGQDDHDKCTEDLCDFDTGKWRHRKFTEAEIDDGDACTIDECTPVEGIVHTNTCD